MTEPRTTWGLVRYFLYLGSLGFGGPVALIGYMQRDLVERRAWFSKQDYLKGLTLSQLAPGPLAAQLAMCLGYVHGGVAGATLIGLAFILPSFLMTLALGAVYVAYGGLGVDAGGVLRSGRGGHRHHRRARPGSSCGCPGPRPAAVGGRRGDGPRHGVDRDRDRQPVHPVRAGGAPGAGAAPPPARLGRIEQEPARARLAPAPGDRAGRPRDPGVLGQILWFFTKAGAFVFGSGLAIVPFLYGGVVQEYRWLTDQQFLDAVAVAMLTPGPVVITVAFIGYLVAASRAGRGRARRVPADLSLRRDPVPLVRPLQREPQVKAFVNGVTAAAAGAIAGACVVLGRRAIFDCPPPCWPWRLRPAVALQGPGAGPHRGRRGGTAS